MEPVISQSSNTIVVKFCKYDVMIKSFKDLSQVNEDSGKLIFIRVGLDNLCDGHKCIIDEGVQAKIKLKGIEGFVLF